MPNYLAIADPDGKVNGIDRAAFIITVPSTNGANPGKNLGELIFTDNNSSTDFPRKHGAISSSNRSPWQPVCSATFRFTYNGSLWIAQGDMAEPLSKIARWIRSLATGDTIRMLARAAPVECPITVIRPASPLKAGTFSRSQWSPATRSMRPKFPWALPLEPVLRNPSNPIFSCIICVYVVFRLPKTPNRKFMVTTITFPSPASAEPSYVLPEFHSNDSPWM